MKAIWWPLSNCTRTCSTRYPSIPWSPRKGSPMSSSSVSGSAISFMLKYQISWSIWLLSYCWIPKNIKYSPSCPIITWSNRMEGYIDLSSTSTKRPEKNCCWRWASIWPVRVKTQSKCLDSSSSPRGSKRLKGSSEPTVTNFKSFKWLHLQKKCRICKKEGNSLNSWGFSLCRSSRRSIRSTSMRLRTNYSSDVCWIIDWIG